MNGRVRFISAMCLTALGPLAAAQSAPPTSQCPDAFVQDYVFDDPVTYAGITPCPDGDLNSTPAWPLRRDEIHKEYSRDAFYTRLTRHDWHLDLERAQPKCVECLRIDSRMPGVPPSMGSLCGPILPDAKCRAELYLMPIEITVPVGDKQMTGRTTRLDLGAREELVDRNTWVMP